MVPGEGAEVFGGFGGFGSGATVAVVTGLGSRSGSLSFGFGGASTVVGADGCLVGGWRVSVETTGSGGGAIGGSTVGVGSWIDVEPTGSCAIGNVSTEVADSAGRDEVVDWVGSTGSEDHSLMPPTTMATAATATTAMTATGVRRCDGCRAGCASLSAGLGEASASKGLS